MTYIELLELIESAAKKEPVIGTLIRSDIYQLNTIPAIEYKAFATTVKDIRQDEYYREYTMYFYYVDRVDSNTEQIQSSALEVLTNIINRLRDDVEIMDDIQFNLFTQAFTDLTAGAFATVIIRIPITPCVDDIH